MRYQFEIPSVDDARKFLRDRPYQDTAFKDAVECGRRLMPVTTPEERAEAHAFNVERAARLAPARKVCLRGDCDECTCVDPVGLAQENGAL